MSLAKLFAMAVLVAGCFVSNVFADAQVKTQQEITEMGNAVEATTDESAAQYVVKGEDGAADTYYKDAAPQ